MDYLIDTNILSELQKEKRAHPGVRQWYAGTPPEALYLDVQRTSVRWFNPFDEMTTA